METIVERPVALDVHKASVMACARMPAGGAGRDKHVEQFSTTVQGLLTLADWLEAHGVTQVAMEATGVYWKPVWAVLEDRFACMPVNARHVKQVPGRKTDVLDAQWLCRLLEAGLLKPSLVPPKPIRTLRNLTRYRKSNIRDRQREGSRLHKIMEDTGIKLDCVATDLLGKSGRAMLDALVSGTTDPQVLADLARGQLRTKLPALREALEGRFDSEHALVVGQILAHIDFLDESIDRLSAAIEEQIAPFAAAVELLCTIAGVQRRAAEVIIAETGGDMTASATAGHLASWAGVSGHRRELRGRRTSARLPDGTTTVRGTPDRTPDVPAQHPALEARPRRVTHPRALELDRATRRAHPQWLVAVAVRDRLLGALVARSPEEPGHLVPERLLQDQPRPQPADRLRRLVLLADAGQRFIELCAKPLARGYSRHAGVPPSLRLVRSKRRLRPPLYCPGLRDGTLSDPPMHDAVPSSRTEGRSAFAVGDRAAFTITSSGVPEARFTP
jgi:transposase